MKTIKFKREKLKITKAEIKSAMESNKRFENTLNFCGSFYDCLIIAVRGCNDLDFGKTPFPYMTKKQQIDAIYENIEAVLSSAYLHLTIVKEYFDEI